MNQTIDQPSAACIHDERLKFEQSMRALVVNGDTTGLGIGIHENLSMAEYLALPYVSSSALKILLKKTPAHFKAHVETSSEAMAMGTAIHQACLTPEEYDRTYMIVDWFEALSKVDKARKAEVIAEAEAAGKMILWRRTDRPDKCQVAPVEGMRKALWSNPDVVSILRGSKREVTGIFDDPATGIRCKVRWDIWNPKARLIADLKKTQCASSEAFSYTCEKYQYHVQAALYLRAARELNTACDAFFFVAIEEPFPHLPNVLEAEGRMIIQGEDEIDKALKIYERCTRLDQWPGYGPASTIDLPERYYNKNVWQPFLNSEQEMK